ncbi:tetratricopeptide repeat protein [Terracidiphilus gabretensis]|uniref:tetratricopeptide repeat protein n=1 Tax=Terracidiphilus gabretensis TaxID=1577687 RepID=UPI001E463FF9|nr:tetratricopeptide repeat protein [Terracidiphilus gabretensis]
MRIGENRFLIDSSGRRVYSRLDVDQLRAMNREGISSATITLNDDDTHWVQRHVQHHLDVLQQRDSKMRWIDEGYWITIPICAIAMFWFRKGWVVRWISAGIAFFFLMQPCHAQSRFSWMDIWLTHDQQGRYYYQYGDFRKAADRFDDPLWRGIALAHAGDYEAALNVFSLSDTAEAWYNQGDALAHLKRYPDAIQAFQEALSKRPSWTEARENLALMKSLIPKPPPKKKNQEREEEANDPPDQVKFDELGKQGKKTVRLKLDPKKMEEIWMRNIQTTPADFLRRRFAMQAAQEHHP